MTKSSFFKSKTLLIIAPILVLSLLLLTFSFFIGQSNQNITISYPKSLTSQSIIKKIQNIQNNNSSQVIFPDSQDKLFEGKIELITQTFDKSDLDLRKPIGKDDKRQIVTYYSAGVWTKGKYKDYTRILAINEDACRGCGKYLIFATKDMKNFTMSNSSLGFDYFFDINARRESFTGDYNTDKIEEIDFLQEYDFDNVIKFNDTFGAVPSGNSDLMIKKDYKNFTKLESSNLKYQFYYNPNKICNYIGGVNNEQCKVSSEIVVVDSTGLAITYLLVFNQNIELYNKIKKPDRDKKYKEYQEKSKIWQNLYNSEIDELKKSSEICRNNSTDQYEQECRGVTTKYVNDTLGFERPSTPDSINTPNLNFSKLDIKENSERNSFYDIYGEKSDPICYNMNIGLAEDVSDDELKQIGTIYEQKLFKIKK